MAQVIYMRLEYEDYKDFEEQLKSYPRQESTHTSVGGYYHKAFRFRIGSIILEIHGPMVMASEREAPAPRSEP